MSDKDDPAQNHNSSRAGVRIDLALDESPLVLSFSRSFDFSRAISGQEIGCSIKTFFEKLNGWVRANGCYVGHIKAFIENDASNLWITTTGKAVNYKSSAGWDESREEKYLLYLTVIVFGPEKDEMEKMICTFLTEGLAAL